MRRFHTARERSNPVVPRTPRISIVARVNLAKYGFQFHKYFWPRVWSPNSLDATLPHPGIAAGVKDGHDFNPIVQQSEVNYVRKLAGLGTTNVAETNGK